MKKICLFSTLLLSIFAFSSCQMYRELIILNWQDYMSQDLIKEFEEENNCIVTQLNSISNEQTYTDILNRRVPYDLAFPSDYMIEKLAENDLIHKIDFTRLDNYHENMYVPELEDLMKDLDYTNYFIPYFWGTLGIMYNKKNIPNIEQIVKENGYAVFFEDNLLPNNTKIAMYDSSRDSFAIALMYLGYSINTISKQELEEAKNLLASRSYSKWGTDDIKIDVASGNVDIGLVYTGDYFDAYYSDTEDGNSENLENYSIYAPTDANNVFFDGIVIPVSSMETDLAYEFINFLLDHDNNMENTDAVGYCPTLNSVYEEIFSSEDWEDITSIPAYNPALVIDSAGIKAEVYRNYSDELYKYLEKLFMEVKLNS